MKVGTFLIEVKLVILNIGRIWGLNCPNPLTCPQGLELLQGKGIQIQPLTPFKLAFTPMEIFPIIFFKIHKIETKGCAQSVFAAKTHVFLVQKTPVLFAWDQLFSSVYQNIFKNPFWAQPPTLTIHRCRIASAVSSNLWSPGSTGISRTPAVDVSWS